MIRNFEGEAEGITSDAIVRAVLDAVPRRPSTDGDGQAPMTDARTTPAAEPASRHDLLPSAVDPTVFDEAFLRQLERLMLVTRKAVHGGMKGVRRSVEARPVSVEFTDYRDYSLGDDLRALDWNLYARLEKLFIKLFIEEEDVNVHILLDASGSMGTASPDKLLFGKRAAAALAYVGLASYDRVSMAVLQGRVARRFRPSAARVASSRSWPTSRAVKPAAGPTDLAAGAPALRGADDAARATDPDQRPASTRTPSGRSASWPARAARWPFCTRPRPDELDPPLEGDLRLVDRRDAATASTSPPTSPRSTPTGRGLLAWQARLEAVANKRRVSLRADANDAAAGRPGLRRAAPAASGGVAVVRSAVDVDRGARSPSGSTAAVGA